MAEFENRYQQNVEGKYYVDDLCLDCDTCREILPRVFKREATGRHSYVACQPETDEERELCEEAVEVCPYEAIGRDGDRSDWAKSPCSV